MNAASLAIAEQYIEAFSKLAKTNNTLLLPEKTGDISSMVAQVCMAMYVYVCMCVKEKCMQGKQENGGKEK